MRPNYWIILFETFLYTIFILNGIYQNDVSKWNILTKLFLPWSWSIPIQFETYHVPRPPQKKIKIISIQNISRFGSRNVHKGGIDCQRGHRTSHASVIPYIINTIFPQKGDCPTPNKSSPERKWTRKCKITEYMWLHLKMWSITAHYDYWLQLSHTWCQLSSTFIINFYLVFCLLVSLFLSFFFHFEMFSALVTWLLSYAYVFFGICYFHEFIVNWQFR